MEEIIFEGFGCQIFNRQNKFFIRYDGGEIAVKMTENEITEEESKRAMLSEKDAYEVILQAQKRA